MASELCLTQFVLPKKTPWRRTCKGFELGPRKAYQCRAVSPQSVRSRKSVASKSIEKNTFNIPGKIVTALIWVFPIAGYPELNSHENDGGDGDVGRAE